MNRSLTNVAISLGAVLLLFAVVMFVLGRGEASEGALFNFSVDQSTLR